MTPPESQSDPAVSVKAALRCGQKWVLLRNDRGEWELPGGRVDDGDVSLADVVRRECREELGVDVEVGALLDAWLFDVLPDKRVIIVCFEASMSTDTPLVLSDEHDAVGVFGVDELDSIALPDGYRRAIAASQALG